MKTSQQKVNWTIVFLCSITVFVLGGCSQSINSPISGVTLTVTPKTIVSPSPTMTSTPEIPLPATPHGLRQENAVIQAFENGTWVVKNSEGEATAKWDEGSQKWTYDLNVIKVERVVIGFEGAYSGLLDPLFEPLPPDSPENHFVDPSTGLPIPYGYFRDDTRGIASNYLKDPVWFPVAVLALRNLGAVQVAQGVFALALELPVSIDKSTVLIVPYTSGNFPMSVNPAFSEDYYHDEVICCKVLLTRDNPALKKMSDINAINQFLMSIRGQQVFVEMYYSFPDNFIEAEIEHSGPFPEFQRQGQETLRYINDPNTAIPNIEFYWGDMHSGFIKNIIGVPQDLIMESPYFK